MIDAIDKFARTEGERLGRKNDITEVMLSAMMNQLSGDVDLESLQYNVSYWTQALLKKSTARLRFDDPRQILYPQESRVIPFTQSNILNYCTKFLPASFLTRYLIQNLGDITKQTADLFTEIQSCLETQNVIILSNHASWLNLPFIAVLLQTIGGISVDRIHTLLGPAITTGELSFSGIINFSNLIKTVPDTTNGNIATQDLIREIRANMFRQVSTIFRNKDSVGNIFLIAPSGTTDIFMDGEFQLKKPSSGTEKFLSGLAKCDYNRFMCIGVNDREIMPNNTSFKREKAHIGHSSIVSGESEVLSLLDSLPQYVLNEDRDTIGSWQDNQDFKLK